MLPLRQLVGSYQPGFNFKISNILGAPIKGEVISQGTALDQRNISFTYVKFAEAGTINQ